MKIYSYQFYENVFAASKLALGEIGTPNYSPHHRRIEQRLAGTDARTASTMASVSMRLSRYPAPLPRSMTSGPAADLAWLRPTSRIG